MTRGDRFGVLAGVAVLLMGGAFVVTQFDTRADLPAQVVPDDANTKIVARHLRALQGIADDNDGTRAAGTPGYTASRDYVVRVLERAGYEPTVQEFRFTTDSGSQITSWNVIAETAAGDPRHVVMAGAHLDSIPGGPGIDDNGTGTAALLATAQRTAGTKAVNRVRFAWWGAEELGLVGSTHYVEDLAASGGLRDVAMYLNFDMIGSSNYVRLVYDGDNSSFPEGGQAMEGPDGSGAIEKVFHDYFASRDLAAEETPLDGRSDYRAFVTHGVPVGGLFSGAEGSKTEPEASAFGGEPFAPYEPCYHRACDELDQVNMRAVGEMSHAVSHAVARLAATSSLEG
ncbi:MAG TPA: M28 family peptidase [Nocardioidaceae bacterium]